MALHELFVFRLRIRVVHAEVAQPSVLLSNPEVEADRFRMTDMKIAVGLWRKTRMKHASATSMCGEIIRHDHGGRSPVPLWYVTVAHHSSGRPTLGHNGTNHSTDAQACHVGSINASARSIRARDDDCRPRMARPSKSPNPTPFARHRHANRVNDLTDLSAHAPR